MKSVLNYNLLPLISQWNIGPELIHAKFSVGLFMVGWILQLKSYCELFTYYILITEINKKDPYVKEFILAFSVTMKK